MPKINKTKKPINFANNPVDFTFVVIMLLLLSIGLVMVLSASSPTALSESGKSYQYFERQLVFAVLGLISMVVISKIDYRLYQKYYKHLYILSIILLGAVLLIGKNVNGATRWIVITDTLRFQPSEVVKFFMIVFYAGLLTKNRNQLDKYWKGIVYHILFLAPVAALLLLEPHFSSTMVIMSIVCVMMVMAGCRFLQFFTTGLVLGIPAIIFLITKASYRLTRVITFLDPWQNPTDEGWQVIQSLYAIGSGGLFGVGLGESKQKYLYLPEPQNDFIFSVMAEELGFIGCTVVIILFALLIWRGIIIAIKAPDMFSSLVAIGITSLIAIQVIINIAVVTSSMPATGMPLPFFSYGGTALFILLCEIGVLLNISRASQKTA